MFRRFCGTGFKKSAVNIIFERFIVSSDCPRRGTRHTGQNQVPARNLADVIPHPDFILSGTKVPVLNCLIVPCLNIRWVPRPILCHHDDHIVRKLQIFRRQMTGRICHCGNISFHPRGFEAARQSGVPAGYLNPSFRQRDVLSVMNKYAFFRGLPD